MKHMIQNDKTMGRLILALRCLCVMTALMEVAENIFTFLLKDFALSLHIDGALWSRQFSSFNPRDQFVIFLIEEAFSLAWLFVIYQFWALCALYKQGWIFTTQNASKFKYMALGLMAMSLAETLALPLTGLYFTSRGILGQMPDLDLAVIIDVNFLTAGILFWLIAKIMERASILQEEADLTV